MNRSKIVELFSKLNMSVLFTTFLEDGYEIILRAGSMVKFDEVSNVKIEGFSIVGFCERKSVYTILMVPISMEEMTDYVWRYVEKFGDKNEKIINVLGDAVCALEKAIDSIPNNDKSKKEAISNFNKFTSQIF